MTASVAVTESGDPNALISSRLTPIIERPGQLLNCPAPAKLNLFLHLIGVRADGYHLLQTVFQLLERVDVLHFTLRDDGRIHRSSMVDGVDEEQDLTVRAAHLLRTALLRKNACSASVSHKDTAAARPGVDIAIEKRLPMGGGLGGGSSDAATTLMALNRLWDADFSCAQLMALGLQLGADVPFFIFGKNAFAEGIGEALTAVETPSCWYVVIEPGVMVPTAGIFRSPYLTSNTKAVRIADFSEASIGFGKNDLQHVVAGLHTPVADAIKWLAQFGDARMTGSGACVFCAFSDEKQADTVVEATLAKVALGPEYAWKVWKARALQQHPLICLRQS